MKTLSETQKMVAAGLVDAFEQYVTTGSVEKYRQVFAIPHFKSAVKGLMARGIVTVLDDASCPVRTYYVHTSKFAAAL